MKEIKKIKFERQRNNYSEIVLANLIAIFAIFLSAFLPLFSFTLPLLVMIYLSVGIAGFLLKKEQNIEVSYESIFISFRIFIKSFCVFVIKIFCFLFWFMLLILPAFICFFNYIFTPFLLYEYPQLSVNQIFSLSKKLAFGIRSKLLLYFFISIAAVCIAVSLAFGILIVIDIFTFVTKTVYIVFLTLIAVMSFIFISLPVFQIAVTDFYIISKHKYGENKIYKELIEEKSTVKTTQSSNKNKNMTKNI